MLQHAPQRICWNLYFLSKSLCSVSMPQKKNMFSYSKWYTNFHLVYSYFSWIKKAMANFISEEKTYVSWFIGITFISRNPRILIKANMQCTSRFPDLVNSLFLFKIPQEISLPCSLDYESDFLKGIKKRMLRF